ncbi:MAG TPA: FG-GAP repeat protein, partial [Candidatus Syntrophosphaera sp.]|nr:FG-GAP repeat protein [Candidatus Syntrophosphaera sp.]
MRKLRFAILLILPLMPLSLIYAVNDMPVIAAFQGEHHDSFYGYSMVSLDFNHDGFDDLAVFSFAYGYSYGNTPTRGKVYIYYGGVGFNSATTASVTMEGIYANSVGRQIKGIFRVGDVSGDGF